jgi:hypothetical protein
MAANTWVSDIYDGAAGRAANPITPREGIDFFAYICRHEERHRLDLIEFWGPNTKVNPDLDKDIDNEPGSTTPGEKKGDHIPDDREDDIVDGHPYRPEVRCTYPDTFGYSGVIGRLIPDMEDYCLRRELNWDNGKADKVDWAFPGKQWFDGVRRY